jgi:triosephosphate isomerase
MTNIFVNLKRFEVSKVLGGICPEPYPKIWIQSIIQKIISLGLSEKDEFKLVLFLPEALISIAVDEVYGKNKGTPRIEFGCQGVHWENIKRDGNFGAFTSLRPAAAMVNWGCTWAILGHSEERHAKYHSVEVYDPKILVELHSSKKASSTISQIIREEVHCALDSGLDVLVCIGENQKEHGDGTPTQIIRGVEKILQQQIVDTFTGVRVPRDRKLVIGYEPIWAIGPGKTPPNKDYIEEIASVIKHICEVELDNVYPVVYGGGLKIENAFEIGNVNSIDGGLVALTRFSGEIGFYPEELSIIIKNYLSGQKQRIQL